MNIIRFLFPYICPVCRRPVTGGKNSIHEKCRKAHIYVTDPYCMKCGRPMKEDREYCKQCEKGDFPYEAGRCVFLYHSDIGATIAEYKDKGYLELPLFFSEMAVKYHGGFIASTEATMIVPVPITSKKLRVRGFNQSERLAKTLSERTGIPFGDVVEKVKDTVEQKTLGRKERQRNLESCFRVKPGKCLSGSVIVVDDIFTTGSTVAAVAVALKKSGVERVYFICAASAHS